MRHECLEEIPRTRASTGGQLGVYMVIGGVFLSLWCWQAGTVEHTRIQFLIGSSFLFRWREVVSINLAYLSQ